MITLATDIRNCEKLRKVIIDIKCGICGNKENNIFTVNWIYNEIHFKCGKCDYDTEDDKQ